MSNPHSNKKAKKDKDTNTTEEIDTLTQYILQCPDVSPNSIAVKTCIAALNNEKKRMERDEKLRLKFAKEKADATNTSVNANANSAKSMSVNSDDDDVVCVEMSHSTCNDDGEADSDAPLNLTEWQDVSVSNEKNPLSPSCPPSSSCKDMENLPSPSALGISLAQSAIADMSSANITVDTPVAALALALHSSLRSDILGFKCTGVPEEENCFISDSGGKGGRKNSGFAPPVRELPKGKFLPDGWDKFATNLTNTNTNTKENAKVTLRYRKNGIGATILRVIQIAEESTNTNNPMARICFGPSGGEPLVINIPMDRYVNVDGLNAALDKCPKVKPALHYKSLPLLLSDFCKRADLGVVKEDGGSCIADITMNTVPAGVGVGIRNTNASSSSSSHSYTVGGGSSNDANMNNTFDQNRNRYGSRPMMNTRPTIEDDLLGVGAGVRPQGIMPGGDFAGDILPGGIVGPGQGPGFSNNPLPGGSLMGPNHPYFHGNFDGDNNYNNGQGGNFTPGLGGIGMQPRFDPYYPPGVNTGRGAHGRRGGRHGRGRGGGRGRGNRDYSGDPNPDHERPPNTFGNDMFM